jgi:hypothetical protein
MALQTLPLGIRKIAGITRTHPASLSQSFSPSFQNTVSAPQRIQGMSRRDIERPMVNRAILPEDFPLDLAGPARLPTGEVEGD